MQLLGNLFSKVSGCLSNQYFTASIPNSCGIFEYKASISNVASSVSYCILSGRLFKKSVVSRRLLFTCFV